MSHSTPTDEQKEDILLSARYGELEEVQEFVKAFGPEVLAGVRDENGNTVLHMACGNGHSDILQFLLPIIPPNLLSAPNNAGSTPLHWAALNAHLDVSRLLISFKPTGALQPSLPSSPDNGKEKAESDVVYGSALIDIKNLAGHTPLGEAELAGWNEGAKFFVQVMNLDTIPGQDQPATEADSAPEEEEDMVVDTENVGNIEVEIEDADGRIAKMTLDAKELGAGTSRGDSDGASNAVR